LVLQEIEITDIYRLIGILI